MLLSLHIENIAIIRQMDVDFSSGFTAFTGETGAGKSILIDSIGFLLGGRVARDLISHHAKEAKVSGLFGFFSPAEEQALATIGVLPDEDGTLLFERTLGADGRSQSRINGRMVNLSLLKQAASLLIQIHGQSDTAMLADKEYAVKMLDLYADNGALLSEYREAYEAFKEAKRKKDAHMSEAGARLRLTETLKAEISEIRRAAPKEGEEDALYEKKNRLKNAEKINRLSSYVFRALKGSERGNALYILDHVRQPLSQLADIIPELGREADILERVIADLDGMAESVQAYVDEEDPAEALNRVEERLDLLYHLSLKYGGSVTACLAYLEEAEARLAALDNFEETAKQLDEAYRAAREKAEERADLLRTRRKAAAGILADRLVTVLKTLDMPGIHMEVAVLHRKTEAGETDLDIYGGDDVSFLFSANRGETLGELSRVASGGEVSRVMLALRDTMAEKAGVSTAVYDEIDTGISGKTARKLGLKMLSTASRGQVLSVTHSAQIASLADTHYLIHKEEKNGRTEAEVRLLEGDARIGEIARILGGIHVTDLQRETAREMLERNDVVCI